MATGQWAVVFRHVRRLFEGGGVSGLSEGQLLDRFAETRDEAAFAALLARHGPMVLGVCRGVLDDPHDVDDAFQATFLVLVKKAAALRDGDRLAPWLYGVARRVSLRARSDATRRRTRERNGSEEPTTPPPTLDAELRELQTLIREEVDRLPGVDRMAVVLCYLEGLTHEEAADRLGWPVGTVKGRLARARDKLRDRLTRRGVGLPAAIGPAMVEGAKAIVPPALIRSTTLAAIQVASGKTLAAGIASAQAIHLMEGVIGTMFMTKLKIAAAALVAASAVAVPGVLAVQGPGVQDKAAAAKKPTESPAKVMGTVVMEPKAEADTSAEQMAKLAERALGTLGSMVAHGDQSLRPADWAVWSRRFVEANSGPNVPEVARKAALQSHRDRMVKQVETAKNLAKLGNGSPLDVLEAEYRLVEAERWLRDGGISDPSQDRFARNAGLVEPGFGGGGLETRNLPPLRQVLGLSKNPAEDKQNQAILKQLDLPIAMNFASETALQDVLKYIKDSTQDEAAGVPTGIPIYIDPIGLQDADKTEADTVMINLEGIPLKTTLKLVLHQLGLTYFVKDGLVVITSEDVIVGPGRPLGPRPGTQGGGFQ